MSKEMIINAIVPENVRVAIRSDGKLESFFEEFEAEAVARSNIYLGKIVNIEGSLEACFVDYGAERHGFLPMSEIRPDAFANKAQEGKAKIEKVMKRNQRVVVQVDKEASGTKGARLTTYLSLAGRFMVLMPYSDTRGVSRKIADPEERKKCRDVAAKLSPPKGMGLIVRTAGLGHGKRDLSRDLNFLIRLWKSIEEKARKSDQPRLLHAEADLVLRILRDYYTTDVEQVWIDDPDAYKKAESFFKLYMPRQQQQLKAFREMVPIFSHFKVEEQIEAIHQRNVPLPSGGSLVIDQTEALVAVDVNSGKMKSQGSQEDTAFETNKEAAREIARQLTLRDLGGIIVIDFIDMTAATKKNAVERTLRDAMKGGKARHRIGKISTFGLCTMTRQRLGKSILATRHGECPTCHGTGVVASLDARSVRLLRRIRTEVTTSACQCVRLRLHPSLANFFQNEHRGILAACERDHGSRIELIADPTLSWADEVFETVSGGSRPPRSAGAEREWRDDPAGGSDAGESKSKSRKRKRRRKKKQAESTPDDHGQANSNETASDTQAAAGGVDKPTPQKRRRRSSRKRKQAESTPDEHGQAQPAEPAAESETAASDKPAPQKRRRRSSRKKKTKAEPAEAQSAQADSADTPPPKKSRRRRRRRKKPDGSAAASGGELKSEGD